MSPKKTAHYLGLQANELIRQLFNFGGSSGSFNNPYLLTYSLNSIKTGWGANFGLGYTHNEFKEGDALNPRETNINDFFFRAGVEKKISLGRKWIFSSGLDFVRESQKNKTILSFGGGTQPFVTETKITATGIGPRIALQFSVSERIWLGTEATYYYKSSKQRQTATNVPTTNDDLKSFRFSVPAVLFLIVKF